MKFQELTAGLLALSMLCTPSAGAVQMMTAAAEETAPTSGTCGENLTWTFDESTGTLTVSGTGEMMSYDFFSALPWENFCEVIQTVVIEDGVTSIGYRAFRGCTSLTDIIIPNSVTNIESSAFSETPWLTAKQEEDPLVVVNGILIDGTTCSGDVTIPDGVTSIGGSAFIGCKNLTSVTIPDGVTSIGSGAFRFCENLSEIIIPGSVKSFGEAALSDTPWFTAKQEEDPFVVINGILIDGKACSGDVLIPDGVTSIESWAFEWCVNMTSVTIPDSVTRIEDLAFVNCHFLTSVTIPDSMTSIGNGAFMLCDGLPEITIPYSVTSIGGGAFQYCSNMTDITILNPDCEIYDGSSTISSFDGENGGYSFNGTIHGYTNSTAQAYAEKYGYTFESLGEAPDSPDEPISGTHGDLSWSFDKSTGTLTISGEGEMKPGDYGDYPWTDLKKDIRSIVIGDGVTSIARNAFSLCTSLTSLNLGNTVTSIGYEAFDGCDVLTAVTIPDSVTSIDTYAFYACTGLSSVTIPDSVTFIGGAAFQSTPWLNALIEKDSLVVVNHILINGKPCSGDVTIPEGVTRIAGYAFSRCEELTSVTIPDSVTSIDSSAFSECSGLTAVNIPDSVTSIGSFAFNRCEGLTEVTIHNPGCEIYDSVGVFSNSYDTDSSKYICSFTLRGYTNSTAQAYAEKYGITFASLGDAPDTPDTTLSGTCGENVTWEFDESTGTLTISGTGEMEEWEHAPWDIKRSEITSVILEDGVTSIGNYAFSICENLTAVTIPDSVTSIGEGAFSSCASLTGITIPDSVTSIGEAAFSSCTSLTDITIPNAVASIGGSTFTFCTALTDITILNPDCEIFDDSYTICNGDDGALKGFFTGTIHGYANSTAQSYAEKYDRKFEALGDAPDTPALAVGNINGDDQIDASDAADLLIALANIGAGADSGLTAAQFAAADADGNGELDAGDAATILQYAAYLGSGGTGTLADFLNQ